MSVLQRVERLVLCFGSASVFRGTIRARQLMTFEIREPVKFMLKLQLYFLGRFKVGADTAQVLHIW